MALNKFMHPRNIYRNRKANFQHLAIKYPEFRKHVFPDVSGKLFLDFKNPDSLRQLSITLMKDDFGLDVELPPDRLVPTIPLRLNYILWIEDILKAVNTGNEVKGIDIGTGGSCVYPLLSTSMYRWKFLATEVDDLNFTYAVRNVQRNNMTEYIHVQKVEEKAILLDVIKHSKDTYHFCMCNPPFFSDHLEAQGITNSRSDERSEPHSVNTASSTESVAFGGEVEFVKRMIHESTELKNKVKVYTSMVGKKVSLSPLKEELRKLKITNFSTTEFCQGKTMRWGIGWSFDESVKFPKSEFKEKKKEKKPPLSYMIPEDIPDLMYTIEGVAYKIKEYFKELQIKCEENIANDKKISLSITANQNTWSNQRRKRRQQKQQNAEPTEQNTVNGESQDSRKRKHLDDSRDPDQKRSKISKDDDDDSRKRKHLDDSRDLDQKRSKISKDDDDIKLPVSGEINSNEIPANGCEMTVKPSRISTEYSAIATVAKEKEELALDLTHSSPTDSNANCKLTGSKNESEQKESAGKGNSKLESKNEAVCLCKCNVIIKQVEDEQILLEMSWIAGKVRESMNQVLQYIKNKLKCND